MFVELKMDLRMCADGINAFSGQKEEEEEEKLFKKKIKKNTRVSLCT